MIDISVILNICFLCFVVATVIHTRVDDKDTYTAILCFIWLDLVYFILLLNKGVLFK